MTRTPDEIKKGLECCNEICDSKSCPYWEDSECNISVRNDALAYIKQLENENAKLLKMLDVVSNRAARIEGAALHAVDQMADKIPRWISVEERLPEAYKQVLVYVKHNEKNELFSDWECIMTDVFLGDSWADNADSDVHIVTHWMPLPEEPKEE